MSIRKRALTSLLLLLSSFGMATAQAPDNAGGESWRDRPRLDANVAMDEALGAEILYVFPGGRADRAGIKLKDKIVKFGDKQIASGMDLVAAMQDVQPGSTVEVVVQRNGQDVVLAVQF